MIHKSVIGASLVIMLLSNIAQAANISLTNRERDIQTVKGYDITQKGSCKSGGLNGVSQEFMTKVNKGDTKQETITFSGKLCLVTQSPCSNYGCPSSRYGDVDGYSVQNDHHYGFVIEGGKIHPEQ